jgi:hypothetical protein
VHFEEADTRSKRRPIEGGFLIDICSRFAIGAGALGSRTGN